ncbi:MAG: hypothetical protein L0211_09150 [Planctomycetaceae bacterium]|nr:hypothetical protein [Planctomycetaceae bacterium]
MRLAVAVAIGVCVTMAALGIGVAIGYLISPRQPSALEEYATALSIYNAETADLDRLLMLQDKNKKELLVPAVEFARISITESGKKNALETVQKIHGLMDDLQKQIDSQSARQLKALVRLKELEKEK